MKNEHRFMSVVVLTILLACAAIAVLWLHPDPARLFTGVSADGLLIQKYLPAEHLYMAMRDYERSQQKAPPNKEYFRASMDASVLARDAAGNRAYERIRIFRDVTTTSGRTYKWILVLVVPRSTKAWEPPKQDMVYVASSEDLGGELLTVSQCRDLFGSALVSSWLKQQ